MCGIAGIMTFDGKGVAQTDLKAMTDRMAHRGPDDEGFICMDTVGLGMRRLSIIDVSGGHQPIANETGELQLVLNGEIYNHLELRNELRSRGHVFRTSSDAEVVLHLYEEKGVEALAELNGMFAFALYDAPRGALWIARDRLGIKPLFYARSQNRLVFASDASALRMASPAEIDPRQVLKYLALSYVPGSETLWRGVQKLPPAHYLWIQNSEITLRRYWSLQRMGEWRGSLEQARNQLDCLLQDSINLELRSDVPLGVFLSGGMDSSAIVALSADQVEEPLRTYTICFEGKSSADERFAATVAARYGTAHTEIVMTATDASRAMDDLLPLMDEPLADSALLPAYALSKAARERGLKVLLNGAGGDEIFGGYRRHLPGRLGSPTWLADNIPSPLRAFAAKLAFPLNPDRALRAGNPAYAWANAVSGVGLHTARTLLRDAGQYEALTAVMTTEFGALNEIAGSTGYSYSRMNIDVQTYLPQDVLALTDKATMAASVEGRVPLLDHRLVEFAFSLPEEINLLGGRPKGLMKETLRSRLPADLLERKKEGFNPPDHGWLQTDNGYDVAGELLGSRCGIVDSMVDAKALARTLASTDARRQAAPLLFSLFLFNRWYRRQAAH